MRAKIASEHEASVEDVARMCVERREHLRDLLFDMSDDHELSASKKQRMTSQAQTRHHQVIEWTH